MKRIKNTIILCYILTCQFGQAQEMTEDIYNTLDWFLAAPSPSALKSFSDQSLEFDKIIRHKNEHLALVVVLCNIAYYEDLYGNLNGAILTYEKAWKRFQTRILEGYDMVDNCLIPLGNLYTRTGDFVNAGSVILTYNRLAKQSKNKKQQLTAAINISVVYYTTGQHQNAVNILESALKTLVSDATKKAKILNNMASNYIALKNYVKADSVLKNNKAAKGMTLVNKYKNLALLSLKKNRLLEAQRFFEQAKKTLFGLPHVQARRIAKLYSEEAELFYTNNRPVLAVKSLRKSLRVLLPGSEGKRIEKEMLYAENTFIIIFDLLAQLAPGFEESLYYYNLSFHVSELLVQMHTYQESKIIHRAANKNRTEKCIDILYKEYKKTGAPNLVERAFFYAEEQRAAILKEELLKKALLEQNPGDSLLLKEISWNKLQQRLIDSLMRLQLSENALETDLNELKTRLNLVGLNLSETKSKRLEKTGSSTPATSFSLKSLQKKLKKDKAGMSQYFMGKRSLYVFMIDSDKIILERKAGFKTFKKNIVAFIDLFGDPFHINNNITHYTHLGYELYNALSLNKMLYCENLVVVPDGLLNFVPFEALLTAESKNIQFDFMPLLIYKQKILYQVAASFYTKPIQKHTTDKLLGVFPVFDGKSNSLHYSLDEMAYIKKNMPSDILLHKEASKKNFLENAPNYGILHLSTHANSGNFVTPASIQFYDDALYINELYSLSLSARLVVLSACETGVGRIQKGEGVMSISRGFFYTGVDAVLCSLWQINDQSTSEIMKNFYYEYGKSKSAFKANHHAKVSYLKNKKLSNDKKSPYYWSAFVHYGIINAEKEAHWKWIGSIALLGFFLAVGYLYYNRPEDRN